MAAPNPKMNLLRGTCRKLSPTFRRYFGEIGRTLVNPVNTLPLRDEAEHSFASLIKAELERSGVPVVTPAEAAPAGAHWLVEPLDGKRNFMHGRLPISCNFAYVDETGAAQLGGVYFPIEDVLVVAESGHGSSGPERFRVAARAELKDAMLLLPWNTQDNADMNLAQKAAAAGLHTRKTGHTLFDVIDVSAGRADAMVSTRLNRLEIMLAALILKESGGFATDLQGNPLTPESTTLVASNLKLHPYVLKAVA